MSESEAYAYSTHHYTGVYCLSCATEAWKEDARKELDNGDRLRTPSSETSARWTGRNGSAPANAATSGETCEDCGDEVCPPYFSCDGCDHSGWGEDFSKILAEEPERIDWEGDGPRTPWCDECEDENRDAGAALLLDDDGRGYKLRFVENYTGELTYRQPAVHGDYSKSYAYVPTPIYRAGCRRFTLADALRHWGPGHPTWSTHPLLRESTDSAAYRLSSAVLRHAMRRALPRIVIPSERATDDADAALAA
jgi:hypothetical protein